MGLTKRLALLLVIGAGIILAAGLAGGKLFAILAGVLVNVIVIILVVYDIIATPGPKTIVPDRELEEKMSLGHTHSAKIIVRNTSDVPLKIEVRDDVPYYFTRVTDAKPLEIAPHTEGTFTYEIRPVKRGEYAFPCINIRYPGVLGLIRRSAKYPDGRKYRVYPNMRDLTDYSISALSASLFSLGLKRIRANADGGEFSSLREYVPGDNYRYINWAATARSGDLKVNTYVPERNQYIYVLLDSSRVMSTVFNDMLILDYGINAAFLLADYCIRGGDNIGMELFSAEVSHFIKADKGPEQFELLADKLYAVEGNENSADYDNAMAVFSSAVKRRSLVFVFTQLFNEEEAVRFVKAVRTRLARHLVCAITIGDPRPEEIAAGKSKEKADAFMRSAALKYVKDRKKISGILTSAGILNYDARPDQLSLTAVSAYLNIKKQGIL